MRGRAAWFAFLVACASSDDGGTQQQPPTPDASTAPRCGDGICAATEIGACTADCGSTPMAVCGNSMCETGESTANCPGDCPAGAVCGDGTCAAPTETSANCPGDCTTSSMPVCGNLVCEAGETVATCPGDCGGGTSTCPGGDDVGCFFCWFDPTMCIPPQTEQICEQCLGLGP